MSNITEELYENKIYEKVIENIIYEICELLVALVAIIGNALVIYVFCTEKRLKRKTNYYIISLATADFLVGLVGIPFAVLSSIGLPSNRYACLISLSILIVTCITSVFSILAVSIDRYWAIILPMKYSKNAHIGTTKVIISICWILGFIIGFLPVFGWYDDSSNPDQCYFMSVMSSNYLVFLFFSTSLTPALLMVIFYTHIYYVIIKRLKQIVKTSNRDAKLRHKSSKTLLRFLGASQNREIKTTKNLGVIVLFFIICWIPLQAINCIFNYCPTCKINKTLIDFCIILSHLNSAGNPILYACHLKDFKQALNNLIWKKLKTSKSTAPTKESNIEMTQESSQDMLRENEDARKSIYPKNNIPTTSTQVMLLKVTRTDPSGAFADNENIRKSFDFIEYSSSEENVSYEHAVENNAVSVPNISEIVSRIERHSTLKR